MSNKKIVGGAVIVLVILTIVYIIYLQNENDKLADENKKLKHPEPYRSPGVINLDEPLPQLREDIDNIASHIPIESTHPSFDEVVERVLYLKKVVEDRDGYKLFYLPNGERITREKDLHILFDLTWANTTFDVNKEVNNGRGSVDFKISKGKDQTLVEMKLASNTKLKMNLQKQVEIYANANDNPQKVVVIIYFNQKEAIKVSNLLTELDLHDKEHIVTIDARGDNKISGSMAGATNSIFNDPILN